MLTTLTSFEAGTVPVPIVVESTLIVTDAELPLNPPKEAVTLLKVALEAKVIEKLIVLAGFLLDPI